MINGQLSDDHMKQTTESSSVNVYQASDERRFESNEHHRLSELNKLNELCLEKTFDTRSFNINQLDKCNLDKNWINLNDKKMFLNRNLIYESTSNLTGGLQNQSNGQLNGNHLNGQLNGQLNSQLNSNLSSQLNSHLMQENKQTNNLHNQIITGNAYSNYPFNVHETIITGKFRFWLFFYKHFFSYFKPLVTHC